MTTQTLGLWVAGTFHGALLIILLFGFGIMVRFTPTPLGEMVVNGAALAVGLAMAAFLLIRGFRPWRRPAPRAWAASLFYSLFLGVMAGVFAQGIATLFACWYTDLTAPVGRRVVTVTGHHSGPKTCPAFRVAEFETSGRVLCADWSYLDRHPPGSRLTLVGPTSPLGMHSAPISETNP